jgi:hypothetical protein
MLWRNLCDLVGELTSKLLAFAYFLLIPAITTVCLTWFVYTFTRGVIFDAPWMMPAILGVSVFIAGAIIRFQIEADIKNSLMMFFLGALAQIVFALALWWDLERVTFYSLWLPHEMEHGILPYLFGLPCVGMMGIIFTRRVKLNHND